jgi:nitrite reductase/ring-hydroxylating ferredoxin subunit/DMSO/TMAO reductase YedYZ heme-binding membrane subunit
VSQGYRAVGWTPHKKLYDLVLAGSVVLYLGLFVGLGLALDANATVETQLLRGLGTCALLLLHLVLVIGPLARLDRRFLPLLYNRRHLGVATFAVALGHASFAVVQFHALGDTHPLVSVLVANPSYGSAAQFPFEALGLIAFLILFAMAATSHDFWLANLTAPVWKALHMLVYVAYALIVLHVALGVLQAERHPLLAALLGAGVVTVVGLHLVAGWRERALDRARDAGAEAGTGEADGFVEVCRVGDIREQRARIVTLAGERVAVFRWDGKVSAISNVCQHQNGPLGEGRIVDGCVTCPWHGYQYLPETGASPPPFTERVPTFRVRVVGERVLVHPTPNPAGTRVEPALCAASSAPPSDAGDELYVGYLPAAPPRVARWMRRVVPAMVVAGAAMVVTAAVLQDPFDAGVFEYGQPRAIAGTVYRRPYPMVVGAHQRDAPPAALLVREGKHGAAPDVEALDGRAVRLSATAISSPLGRMLELEAGSLEPAGAAAAPPLPAAELGRVAVVGEIVDSKCFLGVMKPGRGKPHRSCAARCLSGGVPPQLLVEAADGSRRLLLLADAAGDPLSPDVTLPLVGEPVEATGAVERRAGMLVLRVDDGGLRRAVAASG